VMCSYTTYSTFGLGCSYRYFLSWPTFG